MPTDSYEKEFAFGATGAKVTFFQGVRPLVAQFETIYDVGCGIQTNTPDDAILETGPSFFGFAEGDPIDSTRPVYPTQTRLRPSIGALDYTWQLKQPGNHPVQQALLDPFKGMNDVILGFRLGKGDNAIFGWVRLHRANVQIAHFPTPATGLATPFVPVDAAINPFPTKPIRAGKPAQLPALDLSPVVDGGQGAQLRIRWAGGYPGVRLQHAADLKAPVTWEDIETPTNDVLVPAPGEGATYYRLVYDY